LIEIIVFDDGKSFPMHQVVEMVSWGRMMPRKHPDPVCQANGFCREIEKCHIHFSLADVVIYSVDTSLRFTSISPNIERILGYRPEELIGRAFPELGLLHPEDLDRAVSNTLRLLSGKRICSSTYRFMTREGEVVFGEIKGEAVEKNGRIRGFIAVARDVTHHRITEQALKESEKRYRLLAENARDVIWVLDEKLKYVYVSPSVMKLRGYTCEEVMEMSVSQVLSPDSFKRVIALFNEGLAQEKKGNVHGRDWSLTLDLEMYRRDGSSVWTEVTVSIIYNDEGKATGLLGITRDISERKKTEEALRQSEEKYRLLVENVNEGICVVQDSLIRYANPKLSEITGYPVQELTSYPFAVFIHPEDQGKLKDNQYTWMTGEGFPQTLLCRSLDKSGNTRWLEINAVRIPWEGRPALLVFLIDVTERTHADEALSLYRLHLEELVEARTAEMLEANISLRKEIETRKKSERDLRSREIELEERRKALEEMNIALKVLAKQRNEDKEIIEKNLIANIQTSCRIYLDKLIRSGLNADQRKCVAALEEHLKKIGSSFIRDLSSEYIGLTPSEIKIASLIKDGMSTKEIADLLNVSVNTVLFHRNNIRDKVGLKNSKVNLMTYLQTLDHHELSDFLQEQPIDNPYCFSIDFRLS
jgi:PAS domain S-box-containing protein